MSRVSLHAPVAPSNLVTQILLQQRPSASLQSAASPVLS